MFDTEITYLPFAPELQYRRPETRKMLPFPVGAKHRQRMGSFLTTEHTTHTLGTHGNHEFKECRRESGLDRKGLESPQDCQENFDTALRVQEAAGSNPVTRTKKHRRRYVGGVFCFA